MKEKQYIKTFVIILICVLLDIFLHIVTQPFSSMPDNPDFSLVARTVGVEATAVLWALVAFSGVALVYWEIRNEIPGDDTGKGLRYGIAVSLLWMTGMLEGVPLFGNSFIKEFVIGLSDAIPIFMLSVLLSRFTEKQGKCELSVMPISRNMFVTVSIFAGIILTGRYLAYFTNVIQSGRQARPLQTLLWTILMGTSVGVAFILLDSNDVRLPIKQSLLKFGLLVFGLNWAVFLVFMPLLFTGYIADVFFRIVIDVTLAMISSYGVIFARHRFYENIGENTSTNIQRVASK